MQVKDVPDKLILDYFDKLYEAKPILRLLQEEHNIPFKVALRKLEQMDCRELIEYGTSLNFIWKCK